MTDDEMKRRKAICKAAGVEEIDDVSDGYHTFRQLYYQRMMLFAAIVKQNSTRAWKSLRHEDGELCFGGGWFIVGVDTPKGSYTYHYEEEYFDWFLCPVLERAKHWDGHTEVDVTRLLSLPDPEVIPNPEPVEEELRRATIEINDTDLPITVAEKIVTATKPHIATPLTKALAKAITGSETAADTVDMFTLEEINEIALYLMVYCNRHKEGD